METYSASIPKSGALISLPEGVELTPGETVRIMDYNRHKEVTAVVEPDGTSAKPVSRVRDADDQAESKAKGSIVTKAGTLAYIALIAGEVFIW